MGVNISIITINYNNANGLQKTMQSVIHQTFKGFEYIIVDGNSSDQSREIINENAKISTEILLKWISEPDKGIYNAMNKGIKMSTGDFLLFLNSGDILFENTVIEKCSKTMNEKFDLISGRLTLINENEEINLSPPKELNLYQSIYNHLTHPNTFIKRTLFDKYGLYNEKNKIVSDWEFFFLASGINQCKYISIDINTAIFYEDGISSKNIKLQEIEKKEIIESHLTPAVICELEQRRDLENKLNDTGFVLLNKLKNNPFLYKSILFFLRILAKISRK